MLHENFIQAHRRNTARHKIPSSFRSFQRHSMYYTDDKGREEENIAGFLRLRFLTLERMRQEIIR